VSAVGLLFVLLALVLGLVGAAYAISLARHGRRTAPAEGAPLSGFVGKLELFSAAIDAEQAWLAMVGIAKTVVSLYPYLRVIAPTVLPVEGRPSDARSRVVATSLATALTLTTIATVGLGVAAEPFLRVAFEAAMLGG
jgi:NADH:ubiquinone oxidoreductase subunit 2 (subunit N)